MIWIRSTLFNVFFILNTLGYAWVIVLAWPFVSLEKRQAIGRSWSHFNRALLARLCGLRHRIEGAAHLPEPPFVILAKHQSAWETVIFPGVFPPFVWVLKRNLLLIPFFGWVMKATQQIAIDRQRGVHAIQQMRQEGVRHLRQGRSVVVFPEGTRVAPGESGRYNPGGVMMALAAQVPIVPVAHNAGSFWGRRSYLKHPGTICLRIGQPIMTVRCSKNQRKQLLEEARNAIESMMNDMPEKGATSHLSV